MYELFKLVGASPTQLISDWDLGSDMQPCRVKLLSLLIEMQQRKQNLYIFVVYSFVDWYNCLGKPSF